MVGTGKFTRVLWCKILVIWLLVYLINNMIIFDFGRLEAKLHFLQKRQDNAVTWCILVLVTVIEYLMRDMMNYYCLRVFRSRFYNSLLQLHSLTKEPANQFHY